jgi:hypothetical protein
MPHTLFFIINLLTVAVIIRTTAGHSVSRRRLFSAVAVYAVGMVVVHHFIVQYPFTDAIEHWVRTGNFQLSN